MIIRDKHPASVNGLYLRALQSANKKQSEAGDAMKARPERDEVGISAEALAMSKAADSSDDVRWQKVNQLRQSIANGEYNVSADDLAAILIPDA